MPTVALSPFTDHVAMAEDFYKTLEIERNASSDDIAKSYRRLARKYHPDLNPDDARAKERFKKIQAAYDTLSDPEKRKRYDQYGADYEQFGDQPFGKSPFGQGGGAASGFDFREAFGGGGGFEFRDFFRSATEGASGRTSRRGRRATERGGPAPSADISAEIPVPIRVMLEGGEVQFRLHRSDDRVEDLRVKIPPDIAPGKKIRLRGMGERQADGTKGDLILTVQCQSHSVIKVQGNNIEMKLPITIVEALYGTKIDIPCRSGMVTLKVPSMSDSGKRLRVKGQGLLGDDGVRGDMIVELMIHLPEEIPESLGEQLRSLERYYPKSLRDSIQW